MPFSDPHFDGYRLVLLSASTRRVLLSDDPSRPHLPPISVPRWTRAAKEITDLLRLRWQIDGVVLDFLGDRPGAGGIVVVEALARNEGDRCPEAYRWGQLQEIDDAGLSDQNRNLVQLLLSQGSTGRGAFSRLGWIEEAIDWVSETTGVQRSRFRGGIHQLNGSANSCLVQFVAEGGSCYWLKAVGSPNAREARITARLADLFPRYLPQIVGFHDGWNGWLMPDAGVPLSGCDLEDPARVDQVVRRLAELQRSSIRHVPSLLGDGCHDHRMAALRKEIPELTPYLEEAMRSQHIEAGARVSASRLRRVATLIEEATLRLEDIGIPDALMHCDIDFQNVLIDSGICVFTDWAEASIGNPFTTFEQLRLQFEQTEDAPASIARMNRSYYEVWREVITERGFRCALTLMPLIALASNLCCRRDWLTTESLHRSQSQSYARVLARQMDRAAKVIEESSLAYA